MRGLGEDSAARLGLLARPGLLSRGECAAMLADLARAPVVPATTRAPDGSFIVDEARRRVRWAQPPPGALRLTRERLLRLLPELGAAFQLDLVGLQTPQFLMYGPGDHYRPHRDVGAPGGGDAVDRRQLSLVVYLNDPGAGAAAGYAGGALTLHGPFPDPAVGRVSIAGEAGLLLAFRPALLHEVEPITAGRRYTIAAWCI